MSTTSSSSYSNDNKTVWVVIKKNNKFYGNPFQLEIFPSKKTNIKDFYICTTYDLILSLKKSYKAGYSLGRAGAKNHDKLNIYYDDFLLNSSGIHNIINNYMGLTADKPIVVELESKNKKWFSCFG